MKPIPTLATYKPGCMILESKEYKEILKIKEWYSKGIQCHMLFVVPQGVAAVAGVNAIYPPGFTVATNTYENQYLRWAYDSADFKRIAKQVMQDIQNDPAWIDTYAKKFFEETKKFETFLQTFNPTIDNVREQFVWLHDTAIRAQAYAFLTEIFTITSDYWVYEYLKEITPELTQQQIEILLMPTTKSFVREYQEALIAAKSDIDFKDIATKYYWIKGSYFKVPVLTIEDLKKEKSQLNLAQDYKQDKSLILRSVKRNKELALFVKLVETFVAIQDVRKSNVLRLNYALYKVAQILERKFSQWKTDDLLSFTPHEILALCDGALPEDQKSTIKNRDKRSAWIFTEKEYCIAVDHKTIRDMTVLLKEQKKDITGYCASKGIVKGTAKIILSENDFSKFNEGDILITSMTRPEFIPIMRKAAAFVTDEGGITCHAAIVARELNKPCVIGTKNGTRILRDGNIIEVDADKGVITIIK